MILALSGHHAAVIRAVSRAEKLPRPEGMITGDPRSSRTCARPDPSCSADRHANHHGKWRELTKEEEEAAAAAELRELAAGRTDLLAEVAGAHRRQRGRI